MEKDLALQQLLDGKNIQYEIIRHEEPIRSAQQGAEFFGIAAGQTAPVLIVDTDQGFFAVVLSGDRGRLDCKVLSGILGCRRAAMASRNDVERLTGCLPGDLPLLGLDLPYVIDRRLDAYAFVYGGAGFPGRTLKVEPAALVKVNRVVATLGTGDDYAV